MKSVLLNLMPLFGLESKIASISIASLIYTSMALGP